jgi:hypothetical protein
VDPVADLGTEHAVNKFVLGDPTEAGKRWALDDRLEVLPVAADIGSGTRDRSFDAILQLIWRYRHDQKRSESRPEAILNEA